MPTEAIEDFDAEGEREARVFTLWLNSLNVDPSVYSLFDDLKVCAIMLSVEIKSHLYSTRMVWSSSKRSTK